MIPRTQLLNGIEGICSACDANCPIAHLAQTSSRLSISIALNREPKAVKKITNCPKFQQLFGVVTGDVTI